LNLVGTKGRYTKLLLIAAYDHSAKNILVHPHNGVTQSDMLVVLDCRILKYLYTMELEKIVSLKKGI
jgi:hypothetical protein